MIRKQATDRHDMILVALIMGLVTIPFLMMCTAPEDIHQNPTRFYNEVVNGHVYSVADCPHHAKFAMVHSLECPCFQKDTL